MTKTKTSSKPRRARLLTAALWTLALGITLVSAVWQRMTGPTYPVTGTVNLGGEQVQLKLDRTHGGPGDQPVVLTVPDLFVSGQVAWRRYPTNDEWQTIDLVRNGDRLEAALPHQPPAGKLEYQVRLLRAEGRTRETVFFPPRPAITRFKGDVSAAVLIPHILAMFLGMLWSTRAGLEALARGERQKRLAISAFVLLAVGGFVLGPIVQNMAFGDWWTGFPFGYDLTDNKTLIAGLAWVWALWRLKGRESARSSVLIASLVTLVVFAIPHSAWGSEIKWE
ncbi:MAG: hypothetical protein ACE148_01840 [Vicinamibacterales bacterium]